ncbi:peptidyl-prolyl cis-trans isomerase [Pseudomonas sp. 2FG]|uniref:peptidyl-prolyl cis-trans isomerase n=1 Tax=Pseudomonas sp. 2FG TaxID=2502191 RepID=UPI0010F8F7B3|nr:peptidyl-prolyl cis-trans isomerase [Pseudomonas sp. 2FG]
MVKVDCKARGPAAGLGRALVLALGLGLGFAAQAAGDLRIDGERLPGKSIELLQQALLRVKFNTDPRQLREGLVENRLLARAVEAELNQANRRDLDALVEEEAASLIERVHGQRLQRDIGPFLRNPQPLSAELLRQTLAPAAQGVVVNSLWLSEAQRQAAAGIALLDWQFPGQPARRLSLLELYEGVSVQGQVELQQGNLEYLAREVQQRVRRDYLWYQLGQQGFGAEEQAGVRRLVRDKLVRHKYLHQIGLYSDFHHETESLKQLARQVSDAEAQAYYQANLAQYQNVARVQAAHIRLADQATADKVYAELQNGLAFDEAVRRYSIAADKTRTPPGDLGLIRHDDSQLDFLHKAALIQKAASQSQPMLIDGAFEIIRVRAREDRQLPLSDPSVRYEINQAVAKQKLAVQFDARLKTLRAAAQVAGA